MKILLRLIAQKQTSSIADLPGWMCVPECRSPWSQISGFCELQNRYSNQKNLFIDRNKKQFLPLVCDKKSITICLSKDEAGQSIDEQEIISMETVYFWMNEKRQ